MSFTQRLLGASFQLFEDLVEAQQNRGSARNEALNRASGSLDKVRIYLRLAHRWKWLSEGQYQHVARMVAEIGKLLGGWQNATQGKT